MGVQVNGKARGEITIPADADEDTAMRAAKDVEKVRNQIEGKEIKKVIYVPGRILNIIAK
jgi:leucyl-tRNA synthetase